MRRSIILGIGAFSLLVGLVACGDDESSSGSGGSGAGGSSSSATSSGATSSSSSSGTGGAGGEAPALEVAWEACPLDSNASSGDDAECALVDVPLDWVGDPFGETIEIFVKRWPVLAAPAAHHFWMIQGGPGVSSMEFETKVQTIGASFPDAQFYFRDPRGVGRSTRLGCPGAEDDDSDAGLEVTLDEWPSCIDEVTEAFGDRLDHFTTSQTARDLGALIAATRGDAAKVSVFGSSYGTTLVQRYLHFFPDQADLIALDSLANPGFPFTYFSERTDRVGHAYLDLCADDAGCAERLGDDPAAFADETFAAQLDEGGCAGLVDEGVDRAKIAPLLHGMMMISPYRPLIAAVIHRVARCAPADVEALTHFTGLFDAPSPPTLAQRLAAEFLYHHIVFSETWSDDAPTADAYREILADNVFGSLEPDLETLAPDWPVYPSEPLADVYPTVTLPMLLANGTLDTQTPIEDALAAADHYTLPTQTFLVVPGAPHGAFGGEPWTQPSVPCTIRIIEAFVNDPEVPPDTACLDDIGPPSFEATSEISELFFDTPDPWGDQVPDALPDALPARDLAAARAEAVRAMREALRR